MNTQYSNTVKTAQEYYNSNDADNFYFQIWGGEDIHIGLYDDPNIDIATASQKTVAAIAQRLGDLSSELNVIDLGSGYGGAARWLSKSFGCKVSCINLSETQNQRNRQLTTAADLNHIIDVYDANFEQIPCEHNTFDIAWSQDAILHSGNRAGVLKEINRVLKPGGQIIFTDPMQADDCPAGVLQPVLDRIHLDSLGSFAFYRQQAQLLGWSDVNIEDLTPHLISHYSRVREELVRKRDSLQSNVSSDYIERMIIGLGHWIDAGKNGYLTWGILHFRKPD